MTQKNVLLTLRSARGEDLARTREDLERAGLVVENVLPVTRIVAGRVHDSKIADLMKLDNVVSVREEGRVQLPPFHGRVPQ